MENFGRFALHLRDEPVPSTTNNLERYYGHTKPKRIKRWFRSVQHARAFLKRQMHVRTIKQGLISRERSLSLARELFHRCHASSLNCSLLTPNSGISSGVTTMWANEPATALTALLERQRCHSVSISPRSYQNNLQFCTVLN